MASCQMTPAPDSLVKSIPPLATGPVGGQRQILDLTGRHPLELGDHVVQVRSSARPSDRIDLLRWERGDIESCRPTSDRGTQDMDVDGHHGTSLDTESPVRSCQAIMMAQRSNRQVERILASRDDHRARNIAPDTG